MKRIIPERADTLYQKIIYGEADHYLLKHETLIDQFISDSSVQAWYLFIVLLSSFLFDRILSYQPLP